MATGGLDANLDSVVAAQVRHGRGVSMRGSSTWETVTLKEGGGGGRDRERKASEMRYGRVYNTSEAVVQGPSGLRGEEIGCL